MKKIEIKNYLLRKGIKSHIKGFNYMATAVELCHENKSYLRGLTTKLYPEIAKIYEDSPYKVERALRYCIESQTRHTTIGEFINLTLLEFEENDK